MSPHAEQEAMRRCGVKELGPRQARVSGRTPPVCARAPMASQDLGSCCVRGAWGLTWGIPGVTDVESEGAPRVA